MRVKQVCMRVLALSRARPEIGDVPASTVTMPGLPPSEFEGPTILLVDDEELVRSFCRRALVSDGAQVVEVAGGQAALELVQDSGDDFDLVITDLKMPGIGGREVAEVLAIFRPELPVLAMSGDPGATIDRRLALLPKPFTPDQLVMAARRLRGQTRRIRAHAEEKRARARQFRTSAAAARFRAAELRDQVDLVAAALELRRLEGLTAGMAWGVTARIY
jgi:CheY-like chemotaxis protein